MDELLKKIEASMASAHEFMTLASGVDGHEAHYYAMTLRALTQARRELILTQQEIEAYDRDPK